MAVVTMKQLLDSGVHFGHQTRRWNPKMKRYILTERNGIYIIDLQQTLSYIDRAYEFVKETVAHGGTIMFIGTKKQAQEAIADEAGRVNMPYVNQRWLGGMLTNFQTVHKRLQRLKELEAMEQTGGFEGRTKKEILMLTREKTKLEKTLGGIRDMAKVPSAVWIVDTKKEHIAVGEARKLGIPVVSILDTNCDPDEVDYPIPGNDDAIRSAALLTKVIARAAADGLMARSQRARGEGAEAGTGTDEPLAEWEQELLTSGTGSDGASLPDTARRGDRPGRRPRRCCRQLQRHPADRRLTPRGHRTGHCRPVPAAVTPAPCLPPGRTAHTFRQGRERPTMANHTAADVKRLRELTGSGMMDCKRALEESDGDIEKAVELLRIKGAKDVGKRAERATSNGLVVAAGGTMVELDCETDFVAKSGDFQALADQILQVALDQKPADLDGLRAAKLGEGTVEDAVQALSARIGEKLELKRYITVDGPVALYLHRRSTDLPPAIGVLVSYEGADADAARGVAMHVAAARPRFTTRDQVPAELLDNERRIAEATAREEGKPEQVLARIVDGRVNGYYKDVVLLEQPSVQDPKKTVKSLVDAAGLTVKDFARFEVGQA